MKRTAVPALFLAALTAFSFTARTAALPAFGEGRSCYVNDEENHVYACGGKGDRRIALTFDDGPHPRDTDRILKILEEYRVKATFFVIGENAALYPQVLDRVRAAGHEIGCHTYSHAHLRDLSKTALKAEIEKSAGLLAAHGIGLRFFRPPEGVCCKKVISAAREEGLDVILWSVDTGDWRCPGADAIVDTVTTQISGGEIILMHDYVVGKTATPEALAILLPRLISMGYQPVTVSELLDGTVR